MADGRDVKVWDTHAEECREANRTLFEFNPDDENCGGWLRRKVLETLPSGGMVLDLGCGPGYWRNLFEGRSYEGFDQSSGMLQLAQDIPSPKVKALHWHQGNARNVADKFIPNHFDMVFMASVLQHNRHEPDKREIVEAVHKILKPVGYFLLTENTFRADNRPSSVGNPDDTDGYSFTPAGWKKFMLSLGFELLEFNGQSEYLYRRIS